MLIDLYVLLPFFLLLPDLANSLPVSYLPCAGLWTISDMFPCVFTPITLISSRTTLRTQFLLYRADVRPYRPL